MMITPVPSKSKVATVTATHAEFGAALPADAKFFALASSTNCWIAQGTAPVAAAGTAGSTFVGAGQIVYLDGRNGAEVSIVRDTADGKASLTPVMTY